MMKVCFLRGGPANGISALMDTSQEAYTTNIGDIYRRSDGLTYEHDANLSKIVKVKMIASFGKAFRDDKLEVGHIMAMRGILAEFPEYEPLGDPNDN